MLTPRLIRLTALLALVACSDPTGPAVTAFPEPEPVVLGGLTTDGETARQNLDARIQGLTQALERTPHLFSLRAGLVHALLSRTAFFGSYGDFDRVLALSADGLTEHDSDDASRVLRAQALQAVHRFQEALALVEPVGPAADGVRGTIALALEQDLATELQRREAAVATRASFDSLSALAAVRSRVGDFDGADAAYRAAAEAYADVSPFAYAFVAFQRGVMWAEVAGDPLRAVPLYREALRLVPGYVVAGVHLSELEAEHGLLPQAVARLELLAGATADPEPHGLVGELLGSAAHVDEARKRYDALLSTHREAFLDHGSEFFAGPGADPERALSLALENLALRPTERARLVAIEASLAAAQPDLACELSAKVGPHPVSLPLQELAAASCK